MSHKLKPKICLTPMGKDSKARGPKVNLFSSAAARASMTTLLSVFSPGPAHPAGSPVQRFFNMCTPTKALGFLASPGKALTGRGMPVKPSPVKRTADRLASDPFTDLYSPVKSSTGGLTSTKQSSNLCTPVRNPYKPPTPTLSRFLGASKNIFKGRSDMLDYLEITSCRTPVMAPAVFKAKAEVLKTPLRRMDRRTPTRRCSWGGHTPECSKELEWSPHLDYRTPRSRAQWEFNSPLRGSPAKRVFSWGWEGEFTLDPWIEDDIEDEVFGGLRHEDYVPFTDLNHRVTHMLHLKDYENLPPTI